MGLLNPSDYMFEDVSDISITGQFLPSRSDNVIRGEDIARIREYAAGTEDIMGFGNPFFDVERVHKIVDLSYIKNLWWDVQKARNDRYPTSQDYGSWFGKFQRLSTSWNLYDSLQTLRNRYSQIRIRTGNLVTPSAGDALQKSAIVDLINGCAIRQSLNNYFYFSNTGGHVEFDLTNESGTTLHMDAEPYGGSNLPWETPPQSTMYWTRSYDGVQRYSKVASNHVFHPPFVPTIHNGINSSRFTWDTVFVAVKSVGDFFVTAQNCAIFWWHDYGIIASPYGDNPPTQSQIQNLLSQVPAPSGSGSIREECVYVASIGNLVWRAWPHSVA